MVPRRQWPVRAGRSASRLKLSSVQHRYVLSVSFLFFSMPMSCQSYDRPFLPRRNGDAAGLEPCPVCGQRKRSCREVAARRAAWRFSVATGAHALCVRPGRNVPPAGALTCSARFDASGTPLATRYEKSVFNRVIDLRGVPFPVTTLWAGDSFVNRRTYTLARGPVFGAKLTILSFAQSPPPRMGTRLLQNGRSNGRGPSRQC